MRTIRYREIADDLRRRVASGELAPGRLLPSEAELSARYGASRVTIRRALEGLRGHALLAGARGGAPVDMDALCGLVSRFSAMAAGAKERIAEIEINPVLAGPDGAVAVDCLTLRRKEVLHHAH